MKFQIGHRAVLAVWGLTGAIVLTACATYEPPQRPANELALIAIADNTARISLTAVDGVGTSKLRVLTDGASES